MPFKDIKKQRAAERRSYRKHRKERLARNKLWRDAHKERQRFMVNEHTKRRQRERKAYTDALKNKPCMDCGNRFPPECMDFDHRNPSTKKFSIGGKASLSLASLLAEIAKCDLVCACCHRIRTQKAIRQARGE